MTQKCSQLEACSTRFLLKQLTVDNKQLTTVNYYPSMPVNFCQLLLPTDSCVPLVSPAFVITSAGQARAGLSVASPRPTAQPHAAVGFPLLSLAGAYSIHSEVK
jgi:hypothetical protein